MQLPLHTDNAGNVSVVSHVQDTEAASTCPVCYELLNRELLGALPCAHLYHLECLQLWSSQSNTCPLDRQPFAFINVKDKDNGVVLRQIRVATRVQPEAPRLQTDYNAGDDEPVNFPRFDEFGNRIYDPSDLCRVCHLPDRPERMLLCDRCDEGTHLECCGLTEIPAGNWYCSRCDPIIEADRAASANQQDQQPSAASGSTSRRRTRQHVEPANPSVTRQNRIIGAIRQRRQQRERNQGPRHEVNAVRRLKTRDKSNSDDDSDYEPDDDQTNDVVTCTRLRSHGPAQSLARPHEDSPEERRRRSDDAKSHATNRPSPVTRESSSQNIAVPRLSSKRPLDEREEAAFSLLASEIRRKRRIIHSRSQDRNISTDPVFPPLSSVTTIPSTSSAPFRATLPDWRSPHSEPLIAGCSATPHIANSSTPSILDDLDALPLVGKLKKVEPRAPMPPFRRMLPPSSSNRKGKSSRIPPSNFVEKEPEAAKRNTNSVASTSSALVQCNGVLEARSSSSTAAPSSTSSSPLRSHKTHTSSAHVSMKEVIARIAKKALDPVFRKGKISKEQYKTLCQQATHAVLDELNQDKSMRQDIIRIENLVSNALAPWIS
ncbi:hypothetical protein SeMB42_g00462 [Synchytrium endobioticum]|uniref:PHD-type domain-containing protein n=1 Tax=Synchytrium endobioticum TaxID=286115 RepID=A0A507DI84_9FUNG|nr:hypothetical protein SeLEV6574_g00325 [Synchytrium endobioticum]TPX54066.1 hypothetical protein SeMB42_g00462 [Synchytrium endobioticum]